MYKGNRGFAPRGDNGGGGGYAPVKVGEELEVKIEAVGEKGDGIARKQGFVLFVPNTKQGDLVKIRITKVLRKVGFAEVVDGKGSSEGEQPPKEEGSDDQPVETAPEDSENFGEDQESEDSEENREE